MYQMQCSRYMYQMDARGKIVHCHLPLPQHQCNTVWFTGSCMLPISALALQVSLGMVWKVCGLGEGVGTQDSYENRT